MVDNTRYERFRREWKRVIYHVRENGIESIFGYTYVKEKLKRVTMSML